ncbi:hypothetical protein BVY04_04620 [bacterium M21]|nr:hypothetical protein BVY04_04620 [bacterium M21]
MVLRLCFLVGFVSCSLLAQEKLKEPSWTEMETLLGKRADSTVIQGFLAKYKLSLPVGPKRIASQFNIRVGACCLSFDGFIVSEFSLGVFHHYENRPTYDQNLTLGLKPGLTAPMVKETLGAPARSSFRILKGGVRELIYEYPQHRLQLKLLRNRLCGLTMYQPKAMGISADKRVSLVVAAKNTLDTQQNLIVLATLVNTSEAQLKLLNLAHTQPGARKCFRIWGTGWQAPDIHREEAGSVCACTEA